MAIDEKILLILRQRLQKKEIFKLIAIDFHFLFDSRLFLLYTDILLIFEIFKAHKYHFLDPY